MEAKVEISPFLPGTKVQFAWDSTGLGYAKRCWKLYELAILEGWETPEESVHLRFGIEYHATLADYQHQRAEGNDHNDSLRNVVRNLLVRISDWDPDRTTKAATTKNPETLLRTVIWYLDEYQDDVAKTVIWSDGTPAVEQSFRFELDWGPETARNERGQWTPNQPYILCGHLDQIVDYQGERFVMDHKTTGRPLTSYYFDMYEPDNQMSLYSLASQVVLHSPVKGVIINATQIGVGFSRFARGFTFRVADQLKEWVDDLRFWLRAAEQRALEGYWPHNDTACDKYGGCKFREVCSKSPKVRERFLKANYIQLPEKERWNPLRTR